MDTSIYSPARDTTNRLAADSTRLCVQTLGVTVDELQLLDLARAQLVYTADSAAKVSSQRFLRAASPTTRAWTLYLIVLDAITARPARMTYAREALASLDSMGVAAGKPRILAHAAVARAAQRRFDEKLAVSESDVVIRLWPTIPRPLGLQVSTQLAQAYLLNAEVAVRTGGARTAQTLLDSAVRAVPPQAPIARRMVDMKRRAYAILGKPAVTVDAAFWYPAGAKPVPYAGRVTILSSVSHSCGQACRDRYRMLRRMASRFGERVQILNIAKTQGFIADSAPIAPIDEAKYDSAYFIGRHSLPGKLGVVDTRFERLPDGRRRNRPTAFEVSYPGATFVVVDKKGVVRYVTDVWDVVLEASIAAFIERLLAEP